MRTPRLLQRLGSNPGFIVELARDGRRPTNSDFRNSKKSAVCQPHRHPNKSETDNPLPRSMDAFRWRRKATGLVPSMFSNDERDVVVLLVGAEALNFID